MERRKRKISFEALFFLFFQLSIIKNRKKYPWTRPSHFHRSINCQITKKKKKKKKKNKQSLEREISFFYSIFRRIFSFTFLSLYRSSAAYTLILLITTQREREKEREREGKRGKKLTIVARGFVILIANTNIVESVLELGHLIEIVVVASKRILEGGIAVSG